MRRFPAFARSVNVRASAWQAGLVIVGCSLVAAQQPPPAPALPAVVPVRPIEPPATPLQSEAASAGVTKFAFIAYGDTRSSGAADVPGDGQILHPIHSQIVDRMIARVRERASSPF